MLIFTGIKDAHLPGPTYVTIGNFDGLHRGHQALLQRLQALTQPPATAGKNPQIPLAQTALVTFDPHPLQVLRPQEPHYLLTTPRERLTLAAALGIDVGVLQPFTRAVANLEARQFMQLLKNHLGMVALLVGPDFALGRNRSGDLPALRALGGELGYDLHVLETIHEQGKAVRSTLIRQAVQEGDVPAAAQMLGRNYHLTGIVIPGDQRGRQIGVPTANLQIAPEKLLPANGVYATFIQAAGATQRWLSVTNLGVRPTVDGLHHRVETHLLDFPPTGTSGDLYGQTLTVEFVARLRGEIRFPNLAALVTQIRADIAQAREIL